MLKTHAPLDIEVMTRDGCWKMMRLRPYRTMENRVDGVVITFVDTTGRKQAEDALAEEMRAMKRLQELSTRSIETGELEPPLTEVLKAAIDILGADFGNIQVFDQPAQVLRILVHSGFQKRFLDHFAEVDAAEGSTCGMALAAKRAVVIEDVETEPAYAPSLDEARAAGYRAVLSTPLLTGSGKLVGMLSTQFRHARRFSEHDFRLVDICARQAADAINAHMLQRELRESEARLRKVLETDAVAVMFFDDEGALIDANDAFLRMTGHSRQQVAAHELTLRSMTPPEWLEATEKQMASLRQTGRVGPYEKEYLLEDGSRRWMMLAGRRIERNMLVKYGIDISDRKRAEQLTELLARELSHRVKNTLSVVQALAVQTHADTAEGFREAFLGRLEALALAHSLLLESHWSTADLETLVRQTVAAYQPEGPGRIRITGAPVTVSAKQALGLSLVLHELATNAVKYGSLSVEAGQLGISWEILRGGDDAGHLRLHWIERGGPSVAPPEKNGFGAQLILRASHYELDGEARLTFAPDGAEAEITFPLGED